MPDFRALLFPGEKLLKSCEDYRFRPIVNCERSIGHITVEVDNFLRLKHLGLIDANVTYPLIMEQDFPYRGFVDCYPDIFDFTVIDPNCYQAVRELTMFRPDLTLDIGLSNWKHAPLRDQPYVTLGRGGMLFCKAAWRNTVADMLGHWTRRRESWNYKPWKRRLKLPDYLADAIGADGRKIACIHIKAWSGNATSAAPAPASYLPALVHLLDRGYRLVFAGREKMPEEFAALDIVDYARGPFASVSNDYRLFRNADFALICGSGIGMIPDVLEIPYVYVNSWHIFFPQPSAYCVDLPALVRKRATGQLLSFSEQTSLFTRREPFEPWDFPVDRAETRLATEDEILAATQEALALTDPLPGKSRLQQRADEIDELGFRKVSLCRYSQYFLEKHEALIR